MLWFISINLNLVGRGALLSILKPKICEKKILKLDMFQFFLNNIHEYCDAPRP
jgi:hypothetical protein